MIWPRLIPLSGALNLIMLWPYWLLILIIWYKQNQSQKMWENDIMIWEPGFWCISKTNSNFFTSDSQIFLWQVVSEGDCQTMELIIR